MRKLCVVVGICLAVTAWAAAEDPGKGEPSVRNPEAAEATGGPDGFGYQYIDNGEVSGLPPTYSPIDITATGTALALIDDGEANITLPFAFPFYGSSYTDVRVGNNGGLLVGATSGDVFAGNDCVAAASTVPRISVFWDDIDSDTGNVYWQAFADCPHPDCAGQCAVIEWYNRPHFSNVGSATFEGILCESGDILLQYDDVVFGSATFDNGVSATVGIEDEGQNASYVLEYSCNQAVITAGLAIKFTTGPVPVDLQSLAVE